MNSKRSTELLTTILRDVSRSFYLTLRVLPQPVRSQIGLAYLLARTTDTIADTNVLPVEERLVALEKLRARIQGETTEPIHLGSLVRHQGSHAERKLLERVEDMLGLHQQMEPWDRQQISGVVRTITVGQSEDLTLFGRAREGEVLALNSTKDLERYTYLVAGCVGEFWTHLCRRHLFPEAALDQETLLERGVRFGQGLQLVNILRDMPSDLRMGRCYIPSAELAEVGLRPNALLEHANFSKFQPLFSRWLSCAEDHLRQGWAYTNMLPRAQLRVRLACAWPCLIGIDTLKLLRTSNPLDPVKRVKISRKRVRAIMLRSVICYPVAAAWRAMAPLE